MTAVSGSAPPAGGPARSGDRAAGTTADDSRHVGDGFIAAGGGTTADSNAGSAADDAASTPPAGDAHQDQAGLRASLRAAFGGRMLVEPADTAPFLEDYRRRWGGEALAVVQPDSTADVAAVVRWCRAHGHAVVPQGGNTGLTGAGVPGQSSRPTVLLSLSRLRQVRQVDPIDNTMVVEAGCTLLVARQAAEAQGRLFPLSLASEGSCTVGGNLATNAGGVQVLCYGNMRELCLGLEVVTASGEIWDGLTALRKNNTGYDLRDLFIGSEGTLGVITAAVLKLFPRPAGQAVAMAGLDSPEQALALLAHARGRLAGELTAFELISSAAMALVLRHVAGSRLPLAGQHDWYVLLETASLHSEMAARAGLEAMLAEALEQSLLTDVVVATSITQARQFWALRENISVAQTAEGRNIKHDISVPVSRIGAFIRHASAAIHAAHPQARPIIFGHLGDGNLHFNVVPGACHASAYDADFVQMEARINRITHDAVAAHRGAISAEHGIGVLRRDELPRYKQPVELRMMQAIKAALDPDGLMNPGKLLAP